MNIRAEDIRGEKFDVVVSRAVAPLADLWRWSAPLLYPKARFGAGAPGELPVPHGLVCLKGGDLAAEIAASGCRPRQMAISELFPEEIFHDKFILYVPQPASR